MDGGRDFWEITSYLIMPNNPLKLTDRLILAARPQFSWNVRWSVMEKN